MCAGCVMCVCACVMCLLVHGMACVECINVCEYVCMHALYISTTVFNVNFMDGNPDLKHMN